MRRKTRVLISFSYVGLVYVIQTAYLVLCFALTQAQCNSSNLTFPEFPSEYRTTRTATRNKYNLQFDTEPRIPEPCSPFYRKVIVDERLI